MKTYIRICVYSSWLRMGIRTQKVDLFVAHQIQERIFHYFLEFVFCVEHAELPLNAGELYECPVKERELTFNQCSKSQH
jgi:hypothetical protein